MAQLVKNLPAMQETWVWSLGWEDQDPQPRDSSSGEDKSYPLQYTGLVSSMDSIVHGVAKSQTRLSDFHFTSYFSVFSRIFKVFIFLSYCSLLPDMLSLLSLLCANGNHSGFSPENKTSKAYSLWKILLKIKGWTHGYIIKTADIKNIKPNNIYPCS